MKKTVILLLVLCMSFLFVTSPAGFSEEDSNNYTFTDRYGNELTTDINAFATEVINFMPGNPWTSSQRNQDPQIALGLPDYMELGSSSSSSGDLNLGGSGELIIRLDVCIKDGPGLDLCVFEAGPDIEATRISLSNDLETWYDVGVSPGNIAGVDISGQVPENGAFQYVKLTDLRDAARGDYPGADIDAVCALNYLTEQDQPGGGDQPGDQPGDEPGDQPNPGEPYTFTDRYGNQLTTNTNAFAVEAVSFIHGTPWTSRTANQDPGVALGVPDYRTEGSNASLGDLNLGGSGEVILRLDVCIKDGPGLDLCVFEAGPDIEATRISLSNDLETWYDVGVSPGNIAGVDISGQVPENGAFQYVKLTDLRDAARGDYPGADIDAVCALHYTTEQEQSASDPEDLPDPGPGEDYTFTDRQGQEYTTNTNAFAAQVSSFVAGYPSAQYDENSHPQVALGVPDYEDGSPTSTGDLALGSGGVLVLKMYVYIKDGPGADLCIFEAGSGRESARIELSNDRKTWYTVGITAWGTETIDIAGNVPGNLAFRYVKITDLQDSSSGAWPGADIDAVCALNYTMSPGQEGTDPAGITPIFPPDDGETYSFTDQSGNQRTTGANSFAAEAIRFVPGSPWVSNAQSPQIALGLPDATSAGGDLCLGASGMLVVGLNAYLYDGPGDDLCIFEVGSSRESTKIEVSSDLKKWYAVGISSYGTETFDLSGKAPKDIGFRFVRITDLRDSTSGQYPGADIDAVCALNYRYSPIIQMDDPDFVIPEDVAVIKEEAFAGVDASVIMLPENTISIGDRAFASCVKLRQIYVPASVISIGENVFDGTANLTIFGATGSRIQEYAEMAGIDFIPVD